ncbi:MAG: hypothetical protein CO158_07100 [Piscirickettsiaceae bacterium CG_4_9_14_3_um_filter_43_564]|nr:hypothetical protein [Thiomicrospira sp.]OIP96270.1 MAG: hypothetical protein AUK56_02565 [Thiomicrospira sp. CG2_30_44_34]PIQ04302.1 MAG: hypothetical protein COW74_05350 [Piscirickettsiaceae bacterium CG18_big_fil_WC_8_21_14_2_50_44_103]PIU37787.1 MAG: hypothetical protein COT01_10005 [Piscirickettsiaceae bacterium CG07_land_8_20_14_0_80_44_28]PIW77591.1 MAG: hypothetical protein CO000_06160 [Piscirickettsiaceae bacterium CG_4_8_14_3_um_filter_44_38]PIX78151.1 MAG: hypothetical protein CO
MYKLTIENPRVEALVKELYEDGSLASDPAFIAFLQKQKIIRDLRESFIQLQNGQTLSSDEVFESVYMQLEGAKND